MTNREGGINVVREMMGDQAAAKLSASADSNTFGAPIAAYAVDQVLPQGSLFRACFISRLWPETYASKARGFSYLGRRSR